MHTISLLTDFGDNDNFVGVMKAVILNINPRANIVDICHNVEPQDVVAAAFLLLNSFKYFSKGTVHLVVVDPGVGSRRKKIIVKTKDYYFVAPDNGVLSPSLEDEDVEGIVEITKDEYFLKPVSDTFHGRDIFAPVAAYLSLASEIDDFGKKIRKMTSLHLPRLTKSKNKIAGEIIYVDRFGNLITNVAKDEFENFLRGSHFKICIAGKVIGKISRSYKDGEKRRPIAIFNSFSNLEISVAQGSAQRFLSADKGTVVQIIRS